MRDIKTWLPHFLIRFSFFPVLFGLIFLLTRNFQSESFIKAGPTRMSFFAAAVIMALLLMSETILLYAKKRLPKALTNVIVIFIIVLCVVLITPFL